MNKHLYNVFLFSVVILLSCSKNLEDRVTGSWELTQSWRQQLFGRDYFQTGYENGVFTFMENGEASFVGNGDTLTGFWRTARYNRDRFNSNTGDNDYEPAKYLRLDLADFSNNRRLVWDFDDFSFQDTWQQLRARQNSLSNDRIYVFRRK